MVQMDAIEEGFLTAVHAVVLVVCLAFWAVVGFVFWVPLLTRTTAVYCAGMVAAVISQTDFGQLKGLLDNAIEFYAKGFRQIAEHYRGRRSSEATSLPRVNWSKVWVEIIWTGIFWGVIVGLLYLPAIISQR